MIDYDEIESIEYLGEQDTIDINVSGNRLFYANGILTHNSAVEEVEFDHSHISGGISKINTADNVFGIFTSRAMRERGRYQLQLMKTRSSSGVGQKVDLEFDVNSLRILDLGEDAEPGGKSPNALINQIKAKSSVSSTAEPKSKIVETIDPETGEIKQVTAIAPKVPSEVQSSKLKSMLAEIKAKSSFG